MSDGRKFKIFYSSTHPDPAKAGKEYKPPKGKMLVMNSSGIFFLYDSEPFYPSISLLHEKIGNYDVVWTNKKEAVNQQLLEESRFKQGAEGFRKELLTATTPFLWPIIEGVFAVFAHAHGFEPESNAGDQVRAEKAAIAAAQEDALIYGTSVMRDGKHIPLKDFYAVPEAAQEQPQDDTAEKYSELIYAVETKHPNETRHETALRRIRQAESSDCVAAAQEGK
jgi:hypothetical protein